MSFFENIVPPMPNIGSILGIGGTVTTTGGGAGSTVVTVGTINAGTLNNLASGSTVQTAGTLTTGTLQNLVSGSVVQNAGTLTTGSVVQTAGTLTQQWQAVTQVTSFGTLGTAGGSFFGTLSGTSGGGTKHIVSGCSIVVATGTAYITVQYWKSIL